MIVRRTIDKDELKELPKTVFPGKSVSEYNLRAFRKARSNAPYSTVNRRYSVMACSKSKIAVNRLSISPSTFSAL